MCLIHFRLAVYYWSSVTARPSPWPLPQMQGIHFPFGDNKTDAPSVSDLVDLIQFGNKCMHACMHLASYTLKLIEDTSFNQATIGQYKFPWFWLQAT